MSDNPNVAPKGYEIIPVSERHGRKPDGYRIIDVSGSRDSWRAGAWHMDGVWCDNIEYARPIIPKKQPKKKPARKHLGYEINGVVYREGYIDGTATKRHKQHIDELVAKRNETNKAIATQRNQLKTYERENMKGWK